MSLKKISLKKSYDSDNDNILKDFYIPSLSNSVVYKRLAGFFSSSSLAVAARGISKFIENGGHMQLITSAKLQKADIDVIRQAHENPEKIVEKMILSDLEKLEDKFILDHVSALGWMIANKNLEIKIAIVMDESGIPIDEKTIEGQGIFHQKVGILEDREGNKISFSGSDNESATAWIANIEEFKVFRNWLDAEKEYFNTDEKRFNKFWNENALRTKVINIPEAIKNKLIEIAPPDIKALDLEKYYIKHKLQPDKKEVKIKLRTYQQEAVNNWVSNNYKGILEMATATGKTFVAIACLNQAMKNTKRLVCIISAPYSHLIEQWKGEIDRVINYGEKEYFNNFPNLTDSNQLIIGRPNWKKLLSNKLLDVENELLDKLIIFTTHDTLANRFLIDKISDLTTDVMIIADEVHGVGTAVRKEGLLEKYTMRLGLSATPKRWMDEEGSKAIFDYFGDTVYEFPLEKAIKTINPETGKTFLTPYDYLPYFAELTEDEAEKYIEISKKISQLSTYSKKSEVFQKRFDILLNKRADILKSAINKLDVLKAIIKDIQDIHGEIRNTLIYCHKGGQLEKIQEILNNLGIRQHEFTGNEGTNPKAIFNNNSEREIILNNFVSGHYQVLVAMKCLDEGIDIPTAKIGVIVASSTNPREFIQRRGRLLRRSEGKEKAFIYDVIILPPIQTLRLDEDLQQYNKTILKKEFARYEEFSKVADNSAECLLKLINIEKKSNLF